MRLGIILILVAFTFTVKAQTTKQDSAHQQYHIMRKEPKQKNPYAFADSSKAKITVKKKQQKSR